jgi:hypothetical protein
MLVPIVVNAQSAPPVTMDPDAARHTMVRAAGMPLNDGSLPPGMLTVRVVRGAFTADLEGQLVTLDISGGKRETALTGPDGRAQFAHLPLGAEIRVSAAVENQTLTSEPFAVPAGSGVRVLLVADDGGADSAAALTSDALTAPSTPAETPSLRSASAPASRGPSTGVLAVRIFFTIATLAAFAFVLFRQSAPRRRSEY